MSLAHLHVPVCANVLLFLYCVIIFFIFDLKGTCLNAMNDNNLDLQALNEPKKHDRTIQGLDCAVCTLLFSLWRTHPGATHPGVKI